MPDDAAAAAENHAPTQQATQPDNPDRVGEELADDAHIWHIYERVAKEDDDRRTNSWDTGLNNLALFSGLFSAVTTAFIIEAQKDMKPDYAQLIFRVLNANATASQEKFGEQDFVIPPRARTVNSLWIASLVLSLSAALIAIMGKDWIGMYRSRPVCNPRQWAEMRTYRLHCVERWYMSGVIAAAPVLLHLSLLLFGAGLVMFISADSLTHHLVLGLCIAAGGLYLLTAFSAIVFSASPFKSPATQMMRSSLAALWHHTSSFIYRPKRNLVRTILGAINAIVVPGVDSSASLPGLFTVDAQNQQPVHRSVASVITAFGHAIRALRHSNLASLRIAHQDMSWSAVQQRVQASVLAVRAFQIRGWFVSSTWTDISVDRSPQLVADSLSWLSLASQMPDALHAVIFALGDLEIGPRVAPLVSPDLHRRARTEMRHTRHHVDFRTLSRYVLADSNLLGEPSSDYAQFFHLFYPGDAPIRCEEAVAAAVSLGCYSWDIGACLPKHVTQARMLEFLLPTIAKTSGDPETLIIVANAYRSHIWKSDSFNLEAELYRHVSPFWHTRYTLVVQNMHFGRVGAVELLTFIMLDYYTDISAWAAALELIMHLILFVEPGPHPCLVYIFGDDEHRDTVWRSKEWSGVKQFLLWDCLGTIMPPHSDISNRFNLAYACIAVMLLSMLYDQYGLEARCIRPPESSI